MFSSNFSFFVCQFLVYIWAGCMYAALVTLPQFIKSCKVCVLGDCCGICGGFLFWNSRILGAFAGFLFVSPHSIRCTLPNGYCKCVDWLTTNHQKCEPPLSFLRIIYNTFIFRSHYVSCSRSLWAWQLGTTTITTPISLWLLLSVNQSSMLSATTWISFFKPRPLFDSTSQNSDLSHVAAQKPVYY